MDTPLLGKEKSTSTKGIFFKNSASPPASLDAPCVPGLSGWEGGKALSFKFDCVAVVLSKPGRSPHPLCYRTPP
eukprot:995440-Amphidinium_carterae.1